MTGKTVADLTANGRELATTALAWMDAWWDEALGLLWYPSQPSAEHLVRSTAWYALGLLLRDAPGDQTRAEHALQSVLAQQFDAPGQPYHGTFARSPEEPLPQPGAVMWDDYDPNWREFIGTTLALILLEYENRLPPALVGTIDVALRKAAEGAEARAVSAQYSNIALMSAYLLEYGGQRFQVARWSVLGAQLAAEVYQLFQRHQTFDEYNSPTYYGVDLYALALWRAYGLTAATRDMGAIMEAALWRDIGQFYHAGLRNLCGPFWRSYGMDMTRYAALTGLWIQLAVGRDFAPFPATDKPFDHAHDFYYAPCFAFLGAQIPDDVLPHLRAFNGERCVTRTVKTSTIGTVTAWLAPSVMIGGAETGGGLIVGPQAHPATIHWTTSTGGVGWLKAIPTQPLDARVQPGRLEIASTGQLTFRVSPPALAVTPEQWQFDGLTLRVETALAAPQVTHDAAYSEITYAVGAAEGCTINFTVLVQTA